MTDQLDTGAAAGPVHQFDDAVIQDTHAFYTLLREEGPVHRAVLPLGTPAWVVTRYPEARAALADPRLSKDTSRAMDLLGHIGTAQTPVNADVSSHMLNSDPPDHTRLRKLVTKAFTARRVEAMRPRIEQIADALIDDLIDDLGDGGTVDLLERFALPLPITVICELLGVPDADRNDFRAWSSVSSSRRLRRSRRSRRPRPWASSLSR